MVNLCNVVVGFLSMLLMFNSLDGHEGIALQSDECKYEEIFTMGSDGRNLRRLTCSSAHEWCPTWSPDGREIAFAVHFPVDKSGVDIYIIDFDGSNLRRITYNTSSWDPAWSPDGKKIAFQYKRDICVMNADGSSPVNLTNSLHGEWYPAWSPDGRKIAFVSDRDGNSDIHIMDADGSNETNLTQSHTYENRPNWSPDGMTIVFTSSRNDSGENYDICTMNSDGKNLKRLTNNPADDVSPAWSPDGRKIAFVSDRDGNDEIYIMDVDGSYQINLTNHPSDDSWPSWSPFSDRIVFESERDWVIASPETPEADGGTCLGVNFLVFLVLFGVFSAELSKLKRKSQICRQQDFQDFQIGETPYPIYSHLL